MSSVADSSGNLTDCMNSSSDSVVMTAGSFSGAVKAGFPDLAVPSWRVLTNAANSLPDPLSSPNNENVTEVDVEAGLAHGITNAGLSMKGSGVLTSTGIPNISTASFQAQLLKLDKQYALQKELLSRQYEEEQRFLEHDKQMLLHQKSGHLLPHLSDDQLPCRVDCDDHKLHATCERLSQIELIKHKRKDEESAVASSAVKQKLRECLLNKSQRDLNAMSNSPPEFRHWSTQHSSLEQHSPPTTIDWSPPLKLNLANSDEEYPLRKTVSEPSLKMRSSKLSLRQKVIQRNSQLMRRREAYRHRIPMTLDHDDSPNSPPSAVSSQGSSVDISLAKEDVAGGAPCTDAELMLAMSRQYGSLPLMGCWPNVSSSGVLDSTSVEAQMKVLELAQNSGAPTTFNAGFTRLSGQPGLTTTGHGSDPYVQALLMARCTLQRTQSEPIPLPVQLLLQQHKMLLNKQQQDQQLKENHKLYLKKKLLHQASAKKLHMENVDESVESRVARVGTQEHLFLSHESEEEADVIVIDSPMRDPADDSSIQNDSFKSSSAASRPRRAFLDRTRARTLSGGSLTATCNFLSERPSLDCNSAIATSSGAERRQFHTGLAYDPGMMKHSCMCQNNSIHPENPARLVSIWNRLSSKGLVDKCVLVKCRRATREELQTCHSEAYVNMYASSARHREIAIFELFAPRFCKLQCGGIGVDMDTVWHEDETVLAARLAAGCAIELAFKVACGELDNGFAVVRPPGHHAEDTQAMGFCYFNSIGVATKLLLERLHMRRLLIVDWDVHHGNSTQQLFYADPRVLYISLHRYDDGNFFPGTGSSSECGIDRGVGYTVNVAWCGAMMGDAEYLSAFRTVVMPIAKDFKPEMVLVSAGFDAAVGHPAPLGGYKVSSQCFGHMTQQLMTLADRKVALILEGGYELEPLSDCAEACLRALLNEKIELPAESELSRRPCLAAVETLHNSLRCQIPYWPCVGKFADTVEMSYLEAQHRTHEEFETLSALAGLSVVSVGASAGYQQQERPDSTTDIAEELEPMEDS